jgi:hypothetical protein
MDCCLNRLFSIFEECHNGVDLYPKFGGVFLFMEEYKATMLIKFNERIIFDVYK